MHYMLSLANPDGFTSAPEETLDRPRRSICYGNETGEVPEETWSVCGNCAVSHCSWVRMTG